MKRMIQITVLIDDNEKVHGSRTQTNMQFRDFSMLILEVEHQLEQLKKHYHSFGGGVEVETHQ